MIQNFSDHAANERTFLAWLRTGVAIIAFGFVVEKFNLFLATLALAAVPASDAEWIMRRQFSTRGAFTVYEGAILMLLGVAVIGVAALRFVRIARRIETAERRPAPGIAPEMALSLALTALTLLYCGHLFL